LGLGPVVDLEVGRHVVEERLQRHHAALLNLSLQRADKLDMAAAARGKGVAGHQAPAAEQLQAAGNRLQLLRRGRALERQARLGDILNRMLPAKLVEHDSPPSSPDRLRFVSRAVNLRPVNLRPSDASCKHLRAGQQIEAMADLPYVGAKPAGLQARACAYGLKPGVERSDER